MAKFFQEQQRLEYSYHRSMKEISNYSKFIYHLTVFSKQKSSEKQYSDMTDSDVLQAATVLKQYNDREIPKQTTLDIYEEVLKQMNNKFLIEKNIDWTPQNISYFLY